MKFSNFIDLYFKDCEERLKRNTVLNKKYIVDLKILPYFGNKKMNEITPANIREWQNILIGKGYGTDIFKNNQQLK